MPKNADRPLSEATQGPFAAGPEPEAAQGRVDSLPDQVSGGLDRSICVGQPFELESAQSSQIRLKF